MSLAKRATVLFAFRELVKAHAAEIAALMPAVVSYCMYQVPIMTMAYLPDMKSLLASGYCWTPSAPFSMMPSLNSDFQIVRALTMTGLVHGTWP